MRLRGPGVARPVLNADRSLHGVRVRSVWQGRGAKYKSGHKPDLGIHFRFPGWHRTACGKSVRAVMEEWDCTRYPEQTTCHLCKKVMGFNRRLGAL